MLQLASWMEAAIAQGNATFRPEGQLFHLLVIAKALLQYVIEVDNATRVGAVTNTAAPLVQGDMLHAFCDLPFDDACAKRKELLDTIRKMLEHWEPTIALGIGEISWVKPALRCNRQSEKMSQARISQVCLCVRGVSSCSCRRRGRSKRKHFLEDAKHKPQTSRRQYHLPVAYVGGGKIRQLQNLKI